MFGGDIKYIPKRKGEAKTTLADISVTKKCLNWEPKQSLTKYINNFKRNLK